MRTKLLRGKCSIKNLLQYPKVHLLDKHAYVHLQEIVADFLIYGPDIEEISTESTTCVKHVSQSSTVRNIKVECPHPGGLVLWFTTWSDDFDPRNIKMNLGSIWIKTITMSVPSTGLPPGGYTNHTYVVALGDSNSDHDAIERQFQDDLAKFESTNSIFFYTKVDSHIRVYMKPAAVIQDRPERSKHCSINGHAGSFTRRWRYLANVDKKKDVLPACPKCVEELEGGHVPNRCKKCCNWNFDPDDERMASPTPEDYPFKVKSLPVKEITKKGLKTSAASAYDFVSSGEWSSKSVTNAYMKAYGHNDNTVNEVHEREKKTYLLQEARKRQQSYHRGKMTKTMTDIVKTFNDDPTTFNRYREPAAWNSDLDLVNYVDAMMHMIFLGIVKDVLELVSEWLNFHSYMKTFKESTFGMYDSVQKMQLTWCKILPFKDGKYTGWLSENYIAASRLMAWIFQMIPDNETPKKKDIEKNDKKNIMKWTSQVCLEWANKHNIMISDCKLIKDKRKRVIDSMKNPDKYAKGTVPTYLVKDAIHSTSVFVSTLFVKEVNDASIKQTKIAVRLFLSRVHELELAMSKTRAKKHQGSNKVFDTGNFLSCLNVTDTMTHLGPVKNLYEGEVSGEGIIPYVKKAFQCGHGIRGNSMTNALISFYRTRSLERLTRPFLGKNSKLHHMLNNSDSDSSDDEDNDSTKLNFYEALIDQLTLNSLNGHLELNKLSKPYERTYIKYENKTQVRQEMSRQNPMSIMCGSGQNIFLSLKDATFLRVTKGPVKTICCGLKYHSVGIVDFVGETEKSSLTPGLMLPFKKKLEETFYTFINKEHLRMSEQMQSFQLPSYKRCKGANEQ